MFWRARARDPLCTTEGFEMSSERIESLRFVGAILNSIAPRLSRPRAQRPEKPRQPRTSPTRREETNFMKLHESSAKRTCYHVFQALLPGLAHLCSWHQINFVLVCCLRNSSLPIFPPLHSQLSKFPKIPRLSRPRVQQRPDSQRPVHS